MAKRAADLLVLASATRRQLRSRRAQRHTSPANWLYAPEAVGPET